MQFVRGQRMMKLLISRSRLGSSGGQSDHLVASEQPNKADSGANDLPSMNGEEYRLAEM